MSAKKVRAMKSSKTNKNNQMGKEKEIKVKASLMDRALAKLGLKNIEELAKGMDLSTSDGQTLTVEREEGEPQVGDNASPDGEFVMPDGKTIVVKDGVITDIKTDSNGSDGGENGEDEVEELKKQVAELEEKVEELESELESSKAQAKTKDELRILNAVKIAGGEKALAKISSNYKPVGRKQSGANATEKAESISPMRAEIEARRNGEYKKNK